MPPSPGEELWCSVSCNLFSSFCKEFVENGLTSLIPRLREGTEEGKTSWKDNVFVSFSHRPSPFPPVLLSSFFFRLVFLMSCHVRICRIPSFFSFTKPSLILDFFFFVCNNCLLLPQQLNLVYKAQSRNIHCFFPFVRNAVENHSRLDTWKSFCSEI